ncbi:MAG TPA: tripartite tricarboxylate transporter substrate binding protein [Burkholderiales bacterium]|nr:tripartite tricarboxylate transporter substrate binding protein [Burkholderiales bacterium]
MHSGWSLRTRLLTGVIASATFSTGAFAASGASTDVGAFPSRPLRVIVGFPPGSGTDILARYVGTKLSERVNQPVVVDNRRGANGIIAAELTAKSPPDGHTMQFMSTSHTMNAAVYKLSYDAAKSFTPIALLGEGALALVTHPSFPAKSVKALVELAKQKPGTVSYAVSGTGGINHFAGALFSRLAGIRLLDVPYRGGPQALTDVMAGRADLMFGTVAITHRQVAAGKLVALGVSTPKRSPLLPDVPPIADSVAGYTMSTWWGVIAPAGVPAPIARKLNAEINAVLATPESKQRLEAGGAEATTMSSAEFGKLLASEVQKWTRVAKEAGIKAE